MDLTDATAILVSDPPSQQQRAMTLMNAHREVTRAPRMVAPPTVSTPLVPTLAVAIDATTCLAINVNVSSLLLGELPCKVTWVIPVGGG